MEVVASSAEYATELAKLEEEFSRYKWSHAPSILATLLKETSTKDHFLQVSRRLCKALRWFHLNRPSLEAMNTSLRKRNAHKELTDKLSVLLQRTSATLSASLPSLQIISEVLTIKELSEKMKKSIIEAEWDEALRNTHAFLTLHSPRTVAAAAVSNKGALASLKNSLLKLNKLCDEDNWAAEVVSKNLSARQTIKSNCGDLCASIDKMGCESENAGLNDIIWSSASAIFACASTIRKDL